MIETTDVLVDLGTSRTLSIPYVNVAGEAGPGPRLTRPAAGREMFDVSVVQTTQTPNISAGD